jgi:hypothetical protein
MVPSYLPGIQVHAGGRRIPPPQAYPTYPSRSQLHRPCDRPSRGSYVVLQRSTPPGKITPHTTPPPYGMPQDHLRYGRSLRPLSKSPRWLG